MINQKYLNRYREEVEGAKADASNYVKAVMQAYMIVNPVADVAELRDQAIQTLQDGLYVFGDQAKRTANELFETLALQNNSDATTQIYDSIDTAQLEDKIRYYANELKNGNTNAFVDDCANLMGYYVKREAFENMRKNCNKNNIRYARVPSGRETCAFCFMLSSRGFVYWTKEKAGQQLHGNEYHVHCDCIIVPGFGVESGISQDTQIEGYKPTEMAKHYKACYDTINPSGTWEEVYEQWKNSDTEDNWEEFKNKALVKEINTRDWGWLWSNKACIYDKEEGAKPRKKESDVSDFLIKQGFNVTSIKEINKNHIKTPDSYIQGKTWEYKIFEGWSKSKDGNVEGEQTVRRAFWQAEKKAPRLVVSNTENNVNYYELWQVTRKVFNTGDFNINEVLIVGKDGELIRLKK